MLISAKQTCPESSASIARQIEKEEILRRILILMSKTGGGHVSLAEALRDMLQEEYTISIEDLLPGFFPRHYRFVTQKARWLWSFEFHVSDTPRIAHMGHLLLIPLLAPRLKKILAGFQPDLILSVHPLLTYAVKHVLDQHAPHILFAMLFSDPMRVHTTWLTERNAAATFAPTSEIYSQALAAGFDPMRLHCAGWPVRQQFSSVLALPRRQLVEELNRSQQWDLDPDRLTIFASSGAEGATDVEQAAQTILALKQDVQVILATGTNQALYQRCQGVKSLYVFPFSSEIAKYMAVAHLTMGRCSPNILFESLALGKPLIATSYMPGQEEENLRFLERHGLGWSALETAQLRTLVTALATEFPLECTLLNAMEAKVKAYQRQNAIANACIVPCIRALFNDTLSHEMFISPP